MKRLSSCVKKRPILLGFFGLNTGEARSPYTGIGVVMVAGRFGIKGGVKVEGSGDGMLERLESMSERLELILERVDSRLDGFNERLPRSADSWSNSEG